ncbi:Uncharacterised protein [Urinicoccus massiliensis]|uniref:Uncharacterized protein n=1 Tax=Urinicoccus massiliensis TaxID=1723382 RepID=A0A8H2MDG5_9FIRM|nr:hypothetical protein [Urinicoccus massiliensis]VFB15695.1 Uncharacterised protein [Urinicoccus massiliensis]
MKKKLLSLSLALMMVLSVVCLPMEAFAREDGKPSVKTSTEKKDSYVIDEKETLVKPNYITVTTFGGRNKETGEEYKSVVRGNLFYEVDNASQLTNAQITLKAQKDFGFTLGDTKVEAGKSHTFNLDLTKTNIVKLNIPETNGEFEEGSYVISGGVKGQTVKIKVSMDVTNPQAWLDGTYEPKMETPDHKGHKDEAKVRNALKGFAQVGETTIVVPKGTTATEVFRTFGEINKVTMEGLDQGYIRRINKQGFDPIGEFDINNYSGWMYTVNYAVDKDAKVLDSSKWFMPNVGVAGQTFNKNAAMRWNFTMAYGQDIDAGWGEPGGGDMPTALRSYRFNPSIADIVPQWANSARSLDLVK